MKKTISVLLAVMMLVSVFGGMSMNAYAAPTNGWYTENYDGETYRYYYKNGEPVTGWQTIDGKKYYFDAEFGYLCADGFFFDDVDMYYADANGLIVKNKWEKFQNGTIWVKTVRQLPAGRRFPENGIISHLMFS